MFGVAMMSMISVSLLGVAPADRDFTRYAYSVTITNDSALPVESVWLGVPASVNRGELPPTWLCDVDASGILYWSSVGANDLQTGQAWTFDFESGLATAVDWEVDTFDSVTLDEWADTGTAMIQYPVILEVPEPGTLAVLGVAIMALCRKGMR